MSSTERAECGMRVSQPRVFDRGHAAIRFGLHVTPITMFVMSDQPSMKHSPKPMLIDCQECDQPVIGKPRGHLFYYEPEEGPPERWTLLACQEKGHPILVIQNKYS